MVLGSGIEREGFETSDLFSFHQSNDYSNNQIKERFYFDKSLIVPDTEAFSRSGIPLNHINGLIEASKKMDAILMFRSVNPMSIGLYQQGAVAKGLHVKSKTSDWGPMAGYIPTDCRLSKSWLQFQDQKEQKNQSVINTGKAFNSVFSRSLILTKERIDFLSSDSANLIEVDNNFDLSKDEDIIKIGLLENSNQDELKNQLFSFRLINKKGHFLVEYKENMADGNKNWRPLEVFYTFSSRKEMNQQNLLVQENFNPIVADYDLFALLPRMSSSLMKKTSGISEALRVFREKKKSNQTKLNKDLNDLPFLVNLAKEIRFHFLDQENRRFVKKQSGRETWWQNTIREQINKNLANCSGDMVLHGTEMDNGNPSDDSRILIVMPNGQLMQTQNWFELIQFMKTAGRLGYFYYFNRAYWSKPFFLKPQNTLVDKNSEMLIG